MKILKLALLVMPIINASAQMRDIEGIPIEDLYEFVYLTPKNNIDSLYLGMKGYAYLRINIRSYSDTCKIKKYTILKIKMTTKESMSYYSSVGKKTSNFRKDTLKACIDYVNERVRNMRILVNKKTGWNYIQPEKNYFIFYRLQIP
jgi:intracellular sulfur oxidation DsrE/DsrF family protein